MVEHLYDWVDWRDPKEVRGKSICAALGWLTGTKFGGLVDDLREALFSETMREGPDATYEQLNETITDHIYQRRSDLTAFMKDGSEDIAKFRRSFDNW